MPYDCHWLYVDTDFAPACRIGFYSHIYPDALYAPVKADGDWHKASMYIDVNLRSDEMIVDFEGMKAHGS